MIVIWEGPTGYNPLVGMVEKGKQIKISKGTAENLGLLVSEVKPAKKERKK